MNILILGGNGMLGHMACRILSKNHKVFATGRSPLNAKSPLFPLFSKNQWLSDVDAWHWDSIVSAFEKAKPQVVINCIGVVKQLEEAKNPLISIEINSLFPHRLAALCGLSHAKLIHISTDCVFSGNKGMYTELDNPDPVDLYGRSKLLGEVSQNDALTLRTSIIGRQLTGTTGLVEWFFSQKNKTIKGYTKAIYSGLTTQVLCSVIETIITQQSSLSGLYQVASEPINKYDLLYDINKRFNLNITVQPDNWVAIDRSLNGTHFTKRTGITIPSWGDMLETLKSDNNYYEKE